MKMAAWIVAMLVVGGAVALGWAVSGRYNVAADEPHWDATTRVLATIRDRSIAAHAADLKAPDLADPALVEHGAEHYAAMCAGCHLAPGMGDSEMRKGLYPKPPDLSERRARRPEEAFWIIKHGLKMSGMPAWGVTHEDESIWALVAFLQQLPALDAAGYAALTETAGDTDHHHADHDHGNDAPDHGGDGPAQAAGASMEGATAGGGHVHEHADGEYHDH